MTKATFFPASAGMQNHRLSCPVTVEPVRAIDETQQPDERLGGIKCGYRLSIDPWDLKRIVTKANQLGLKGKTVLGFGYDRESEKILIGPKANSKKDRSRKAMLSDVAHVI